MHFRTDPAVRRQKLSLIWGISWLALTLLTPSLAAGATLSWFAGDPSIVSFWDPLGWNPQQAPSAGDDLELIDNVGAGSTETRFLGTIDGSIPAQSVSAGALRVIRGDFAIDWSSPDFPGDPAHAGGLSLASLTIDDQQAPFAPARLTLIDPQLAVSGLIQIGGNGAPASLDVLGTGLWSLAPEQLAQVAADEISINGDGAMLRIDATAAPVSVTANTVVVSHYGSPATNGVGIRMQADPQGAASELTVGTLNIEGATGTAVDVSGGARVNAHDLFVQSLGGDVTLRATTGGSISTGPAFGPPNPSASLTQLTATEGTMLSLLLDGGFARFGEFGSTRLTGFAQGGTLAIHASNGGGLFASSPPTIFTPLGSVNLLASNASSGTAGAVDVRIDGGNLSGTLAIGSTGTSSASLALINGSSCLSCDLAVIAETTRGSLHIGSGSQFDGNLHAVNSDLLVDGGASLSGQPTSGRLVAGGGAFVSLADAAVNLNALELSGSNASVRLIGAASRTAHAVNVGSDFVLSSAGVTSGGDLPGVSNAELTLSAAQLRVGGNAAGVAPTLAIGSGGSVDVTNGGIFVADASVPDAFQTGAVVLSSGGSLWGSGNVVGAVVNSGGSVNPGFSPGHLALSGAYTQSAGILTLEIGGAQAGEFDVLSAAGGASFLGGTLRFERINGFAGVIGAQLDLFAGSLVAFDPSVVIEDNTGFGLAFDLATGIATITRLAVPEPKIAVLLAAGCAGLAWLGRRRA